MSRSWKTIKPHHDPRSVNCMSKLPLNISHKYESNQCENQTVSFLWRLKPQSIEISNTSHFILHTPSVLRQTFITGHLKDEVHILLSCTIFQENRITPRRSLRWGSKHNHLKRHYQQYPEVSPHCVKIIAKHTSFSQPLGVFFNYICKKNLHTNIVNSYFVKRHIAICGISCISWALKN